MAKSVDEYLEMLKDNKSAKRRSATRALGKIGDVTFGAKLLKALNSELQDKRTWETQCAMLRAIGDVGYRMGIPELWQISELTHNTTMLYHEIGFALCRLEPISNDNLSVVKRIISTQNPMFVGGAFMAIYFLRIVPTSQEDVQLIIKTAEQDIEKEGQIITKRCYIAAASAGWDYPEVLGFLESCKKSEWKFLHNIATESQMGIYSDWKPW